MNADAAAVAPLIDHTLLKPGAVSRDIEKLCEEALQYGFHSVCVNGVWVARCAAALRGSAVKTAAVVSFPLGAAAPAAKAFEAEAAVRDGASEIDMVMAIGHFLEGNYLHVRDDIRGVVEAVRGEAIVKVILETGFLSDEQIRAACELAAEAEAHFVKTSTGFGPGGADERHVALMRRSVPENMGVKASGGIRDLDAALRMVRAGADRLGTSAGVAIVTNKEAKGTY